MEDITTDNSSWDPRDETSNSGVAEFQSLNTSAILNTSMRPQAFSTPAQDAIQSSEINSNLTEESSVLKRISLAQMELILSPLKSRQEEVKLMLQEIDKRRSTILSKSAFEQKRQAWEEIASSMAAHRPLEYRRTAKQLKRKWLSLLERTKKKIREGRTTPSKNWTVVNDMVLQILTAATREMRERLIYRQRRSCVKRRSDLSPPTLSPLQSQQDDVSFSPPLLRPQPSPHSSSCQITNLSTFINDSSTRPSMEMSITDLSSNTRKNDAGESVATDSLNQTSVLPDSLLVKISPSQSTYVPTWDGKDVGTVSDNEESVRTISSTLSKHDGSENPKGSQEESSPDQSREMEIEMHQQAREEHALRMRILQLKHTYWQLKVDALTQDRVN